MIKANELCIGNLFVDATTGALLRVAFITEADVDYYIINQSKVPLPIDWRAEPIPLTPQILEKCGFEKDKVTGDYWDMVDEYGCSKLNFVIFHYEDGTFSIGSSLGEYSIGKRFMYLHQLQNLYFALTGEELTLKEKV